MDVNNTFIKPILLFHFKKGKSEIETHEQIAKQYGRYAVYLKTIYKWFAEFKKGKHILTCGKPTIKEKITDKFLIKLVNENPGLNMKELALLADTSSSVISKKINQLNKNGKKINYCKKTHKKFTDEFIIDLINKNPDLSMEKLAKLADMSVYTIYNRIKQVNSDCKRANYVSKKIIKGEDKQNEKSKQKINPKTKLTDEILISLIAENPELSMRELATLVGTSSTTISNRIKKINSNGERAHYIKKDTKKFTDEFLIDLVNANPDLSMEKLSKLTGTSQVTISKRLKKINRFDEKANYIFKNCKKDKPEENIKPRNRKKFTDEFLINLINENPSLCMRELAELANTTQSTISNRLKQINSKGNRVNYVKKSSKKLSEAQKEFLISKINNNFNLNIPI